ncbi:MAG: hypothetical protein ACWIPI_09190, partial [Polaribacter sp.]
MHVDSTFIEVEINRVTDYLKNNGYFTNTIDSIKKNKKNYIVYFSLHKKVEKAVIRTLNNKFEFKNLEIKNNIFSVPIEKLQATLLEISKKLDTEGKSFSKVTLKNIQLKDNTLFADLEID